MQIEFVVFVIFFAQKRSLFAFGKDEVPSSNLGSSSKKGSQSERTGFLFGDGAHGRESVCRRKIPAPSPRRRFGSGQQLHPETVGISGFPGFFFFCPFSLRREKDRPKDRASPENERLNKRERRKTSPFFKHLSVSGYLIRSCCLPRRNHRQRQLVHFDLLSALFCCRMLLRSGQAEKKTLLTYIDRAAGSSVRLRPAALRHRLSAKRSSAWG